MSEPPARDEMDGKRMEWGWNHENRVSRCRCISSPSLRCVIFLLFSYCIYQLFTNRLRVRNENGHYHHHTAATPATTTGFFSNYYFLCYLLALNDDDGLNIKGGLFEFYVLDFKSLALKTDDDDRPSPGGIYFSLVGLNLVFFFFTYFFIIL